MRIKVSQSGLNHFWARNREAIIGYCFMICVLVLYINYQNNFFSAYGIKSTFDQVLTLLYAGLAQTLIILIGGIDLSIGSMIALTSCLTVEIMVPLANLLGNNLSGISVTFLVVLIVGALAGLINGLLIVYGRIQPIIVTLATSFIYTGIGMYLRPTPGGAVVSGYSQLITGSLFGIPKSFIWLVVAITLIWMPIRRSRFGQAIFAVGGNEYSAFTSGINVKNTKLKTYIFAGLICAMSGLFLAAFTGSGDPTKCEPFTLNSIAVVVLGGTSLAGGRGGFIGTIAGVITFSLIIGLLVFWKVPTFYQEAVKGLILILALSVGILEKIRINYKRKCPVE